ncbi:MAG TPA: hypothetical protein VL357_04260 [Rariglobus sp.]|nr:hypothetical protein [Rariglobus sp.]
MFFPSLLFLFIPLEIFLPGNIRLKELAYIDFLDATVYRRGPWRLPIVWVDGIRSYLGALLLCNAWEIEPIAGTWGYILPVACLFVLTLSITVQMHTRYNKGHFLAPVIYVVGVWLALMPLPLAMVAVAAGGVCMVAFRSLTAFFFCAAAMMGVFGGIVLRAGSLTMVAAALGLLPCLLSLLFGRSLAVPMRVEFVQDRSRDITKMHSVPACEATEVEV